MAINYRKYLTKKSYTMAEVVCQIKRLKEHYDEVDFCCKKGKFRVQIILQPTEYSIKYKVEIQGKLGNTGIRVFVIEPEITLKYYGRKVPHMYSDKSLCLYYPKYYEWNYKDGWAETLVPWTALWLYYYEIWVQTGQWIGGGIHRDNYD